MEPLAIIGLACRFPGEATNVENLWNCLLEGRSLAMQIPKEKFNVNGHYHPDPNRGGSFYTKIGHFLAESTALFDAPFFSMSKSEAMAVDPQQRLMLENVYHAFENGESTDSVSDSRN
jgi:acyl transferase domain-containing protein